MIIDVKATREAPDAQSPLQPYRFSEEPKASRWPFALAALMTGFVFYLKSMFPGWGNAEAEARPEQAPQPDEGQPAQPARVVAGGTPNEQHASAGEGDAQFDGDGPSGSGDRLFDIWQAASFDTVASPEVDLLDFASFGPLSSGPFSFAGVFMVANDNVSPGAGSGSGGNGPGGSDGPHNDGPNDPDDSEPGGPEDDNVEDDDEEQTNRAPRVNGPVYLADIAGCSIALIGLTDLLANAVDPDGDLLSVRNITVSSGILTAAQGGWLFDADGYGPVILAYEITDGALSVMQTAHLQVVRNVVSSSSGDDLLVGTECGDDIDGGDGDDNIDARGGNDTVIGGFGNDHIVAGTGHDTVFAGLGHDVVFGGEGDDWISGGPGNDRLFGEAGNDTLFGDEGDDLLSGGTGNDLLFGGAGNDQLQGDEGDDHLLGGTGDDELSGGENDDVLMGEAGNDMLFGDDGNDTLSGGDGQDGVFGGAGDDTVLGDLDSENEIYDGGAGIDTVDYSGATSGLVFDLAAGKVSGVEIGVDTITNFEVFVGGKGSDHFKANGHGGTFRGGDGNDLFEFGPFSTTGQRVAYEILDFMAGDRIRLSRYEIFEEIMDSLEDRFEDIYGDDVDDDDLPILISHQYTGDLRRTLIEADLDNDHYYELAITIHGNSQVTVVETV